MQPAPLSTRPSLHESAWVSPDATVSGDVTIASGARILPGARIVAEAGSSIHVGRSCIVMENAVVRATKRHDCRIGDNCLIGPNAHVVGCTVDQETFIATGASVFHGARVGARSEIRINAVVHIKTRLPEGSTVPIGWIAVGEPVSLLPPERHEEVWALQRPLDFPGWVYGLDRGKPDLMIAITTQLSEEMAGEKSNLIPPA